MKIKWAADGLVRLKPNTAASVELKNGTVVSLGVIRIDADRLVYFTGKGLREMWGQNMNDEERLVAEQLQKTYKEPNGEEVLTRSGHIAVLPLAHIARVLS